MRSPNNALPVTPILHKPSRKINRGSGKYRKFVGLDYEPPHGCFYLVAQVFRDVYGVDLGPQDEGVTSARAGIQRLHEALSREADEISSGSEQEGDVVFLRTHTYHIGVIVEPGWMLHTYEGGSACIESYHSMFWTNKVVGFYRYKGWEDQGPTFREDAV